MAVDTLSEDMYWTNSHELDLINDEVEASVVKVIKEKVDALPKRQRLGEVRHLLREKIADHAIAFDGGPGLHLDGHDARDDV